AVGGRQALDLLVQDRLDLLAGGDAGGGRNWPGGGGLVLVLAAPGCGPGRGGGRGVRRPRGATAGGLARADGDGLAGEQQEGGLEGVLGVLLVGQQPPADGQDQRPVALHQVREGELVVGSHEGAQQLTVGPVAGLVVGDQVPDVPDGCPQR